MLRLFCLWNFCGPPLTTPVESSPSKWIRKVCVFEIIAIKIQNTQTNTLFQLTMRQQNRRGLSSRYEKTLDRKLRLFFVVFDVYFEVLQGDQKSQTYFHFLSFPNLMLDYKLKLFTLIHSYCTLISQVLAQCKLTLLKLWMQMDTTQNSRVHGRWLRLIPMLMYVEDLCCLQRNSSGNQILSSFSLPNMCFSRPRLTTNCVYKRVFILMNWMFLTLERVGLASGSGQLCIPCLKRVQTGSD